MSEQHRQFLGRLDASSPAVFLIGLLQHRKGRDVEIPGQRRAPTAAEHELYSDIGDLFVVTRKRIEVKWLTSNFTGPDDWPFKEVFIGTVSSVDRASAKGDVMAYVSVSNDYSHIALIDPKTRGEWYKVDKLVKNTGNVETFYAIAKSSVQFEPVDEPLRKFIITIAPKDANDCARIVATVGGLLERGIER